jgi:hypothetical protein
MIKTMNKDALPKNKSYPIGAEAISAALEGVNQYDLLEIRFSIRDEYWASKYNEKVKNKEKIDILECRYNQIFDEWIIDIASVPSEYKNNVKKNYCK